MTLIQGLGRGSSEVGDFGKSAENVKNGNNSKELSCREQRDACDVPKLGHLKSHRSSELTCVKKCLTG